MEVNFLKKALSLAKLRKGFCAPNPSVGAVVVKNGVVLSEGFHCACGFPHAEVAAVESAYEKARGSTVYVTLEPCCFSGRTPACTEYLLRSEVSRVVYGYRDPNPRVSGQGERYLRERGIPCDYLPLREIDQFYSSYAYWVRTGKPWVTAKLALSLDGKLALEGGAPFRITGMESEVYTHTRRREADAILTSVKTVERDNPRLNVRLEGKSFAKPVFVIDCYGRLPLDCWLWETAKKIVLFHGVEACAERLSCLKAKGALAIKVASDSGRIVLSEVVSFLGREGIHDVWIEAGGTLLKGFLSESMVNEALIYISPRWLGSKALSAFQDEPKMVFFEKAREVNWVSMGRDVLCELKW